MTERKIGQADLLELSVENGQKLIRKAFQYHAATPNWEVVGPRSAMSFRFSMFDTIFRINGDQKHLDRFFNFLEKEGYSSEIFKDSLYAELNDIVDPHDANPTSQNRGWLDFRSMHSDDTPSHLVSFGSYLENFRTLTQTEVIK